MSDIEIRVSGIEKDSIVDGPGLRFTLFVQGCPHHCPGCHNVGTHDFHGGTLMSVEEIFNEIKKDKGITGVTFSGGEPFSQAEKLIPLAKMIKNEGLELAVYSGWTFEELDKGILPGAKGLLKEVDILVDGRFEIAKKSLEIPFRGSTNQRILDAKRSLQEGRAVLTTKREWLCKGSEILDDFAPKNIRDMGW